MTYEVMQALNPVSGGRYLDVTLGGGGHTERMLELSAPDGRVLATDADALAIRNATSRLSRFGERVSLRQTWLDTAPSVARECGFGQVNGVLADLGLSSNQLDDAQRGMSFMREGALDMRFDQTHGMTAAELINSSDIHELTHILREYGEVTHARRTAEAIWAARPIKTTIELRECVGSLARNVRHKIHPATQVFQALRIAVNDELRRLREGLPMLVDLLAQGGRIAIISFHSLEDGIVKNVFRDLARESVMQPAGFGIQEIVIPKLSVLTKKPIQPSAQEVAANPRARSARLRVAERL